MSGAVSSSFDEAAAVEAAAGYLASEPHYHSVAARILAALGGKAPLALVTGDPPADPELLSQALRTLGGSRHRVIGIPCGPDLTGEEVSHAGSVVTTLPASGNTVAMTDTVETNAPLFVFEEAERLSDKQLCEIWATIQRAARQNAAGVLLARRGFLARLEQDPLHFLREALALQLRFDEIGYEEGIDFLRHQLAVRHSQEEARRDRPILFRSLAMLGVLALLGVGASLAVHYVSTPDVKPPDERSATSAANPSPGVGQIEAARRAAPSPAVASPTPESPKPQLAPAEPSPAPLEPKQIPQPNASGAPPGARPAPVQSPAGQQVSPAEIAALITRGDAFLSAGDIASARLYYERAAEAGDSAAALRLGATFDPDFLSRAGLRDNPGDAAQAASWYRRARDLGDAASAERLKNLERQPR